MGNAVADAARMSGRPSSPRMGISSGGRGVAVCDLTQIGVVSLGTGRDRTISARPAPPAPRPLAGVGDEKTSPNWLIPPPFGPRTRMDNERSVRTKPGDAGKKLPSPGTYQPKASHHRRPPRSSREGLSWSAVKMASFALSAVATRRRRLVGLYRRAAQIPAIVCR